MSAASFFSVGHSTRPLDEFLEILHGAQIARRGKQDGIDPRRNGHWRSAGFHNYADYALGAGFGAAFAQLRALGSAGACAVICAEADWRQCHRQIVCDHLLHHGHPVNHLLDTRRREPATLNPAARTDAQGELVYPVDAALAGPITGDLFGA